MARKVDISGQKYGLWTVIERAGKDQRGSSMWLCKCDCGNVGIIRQSSLTSGNSKSCGCSHAEATRKSHLKHGHYGERLYGVWNMMHQRCENPNNHRYRLYGARGITVCAEWKDYAAFREWAMSNGYDETAPYGQCTIDRIDANGNYCPDNCRFADALTQAKNRRFTRNQYTQ